MSQYAQGTDAVARYDVRLLQDLLSDTGTKVDPSVVTTHPILVAVLEDASADIDAACFRGGRYTPAQLTTLSGTSAQLLTRLCCDKAMLYLKRRRGKFNAENDGEWAKEIEAKLESLRSGEDYLMLGNQSTAQASTAQLDETRITRTQPMRSAFNFTQNYFPVQVHRARNY